MQHDSPSTLDQRRLDGPKLIGLIADLETCSGFLLAGIGGGVNEAELNYLVVDGSVDDSTLVRFFAGLYARTDIAIILIGSDIVTRLKESLENTNKVLPIIVEIPKKYEIITDEPARSNVN